MALPVQQQVFDTVDKSQDILIAFSKNFTSDSLAGAIALFLFLQKTGKRVDMVCDNFTMPAGYTFLPPIASIKNKMSNLRRFIITLNIARTKVDEISYDIKGDELEFVVSPKEGFFEETDLSTKTSGFKYDLVFTIGTPDFESLGGIYDNDTEFFYQTPIINIDNTAANEKYGQINLINLTAAANCEILFNLFSARGEEIIDEDVATALLTGVITATNNFKSNQVTPSTLSASSKLITLGAKRSEIVQNLYQARSLATLKLWGRALARLRSDSERKLAWSLISKKDFELTNAKEDTLDNVIEELIANSYEVETVILLSETLNPTEGVNSIKVIIASLKNIDSFSLVSDFTGAEGDADRACFTLEGVSLQEAEEKVIPKIKERLDKLKK